MVSFLKKILVVSVVFMIAMAMSAQAYAVDRDRDGYPPPRDCDDTNSAINPGATEICNGVDEDCDGVADDNPTDGTTYYADADGDGHGDRGTTKDECSGPSAGYVALGDDCDDGDVSVNPGTEEYCDGKDNDCDSVTDESAEDATTYYADADGDGHGDRGTTKDECSGPSAGYVALGDDCDDGEVEIHPGSEEQCNGVDDDCDGDVDEDSASDVITFYADADGDHHGSPTVTSAACSAPSGYVALGDDCDDGEVEIHPGSEEQCNGVDDDCDGEVDEDSATDVVAFYADRDSDGYGDPALSADRCSPLAGEVADNTDCDDTSPDSHPGAAETCYSGDNDCNGLVDDNPTDGEVWYADADEDGYGDASSLIVACSAQAGHVTTAGDCDDTTDEVAPGLSEICNSIDDDCDGVADEGFSTSWYYLDRDGDGFGDSLVAQEACSQPPTSALQGMDCDDDDAAINPGATEIPLDGTDSDCDGHEFAATDADGDGVYLPSATGPDDCNDNDAAVYPGAAESCNDVDDDCNGTRDDITIPVTYYADADGDGYYGDSAATTEVVDCTAPGGFTSLSESGDCDDADPAFHPDAAETDCSDPNDYNCDGSVGYANVDGDAFAACEECNDDDYDINPNADEYCDGVDNDCDRTVDESDAIDASTWYQDGDSDGYGDSASSVVACSSTGSTVSLAGDCDDTLGAVHPTAAENCGNGIDEDCDGADLSCAAAAATPTVDGTSTGGGTVTTGTGGAIASPDGASGDAVDEELADEGDGLDVVFEPGTLPGGDDAGGDGDGDDGGGSCSLSMASSAGANGGALWMFCFIIFVWRFAKRLSV